MGALGTRRLGLPVRGTLWALGIEKSALLCHILAWWSGQVKQPFWFLFPHLQDGSSGWPLQGVQRKYLCLRSAAPNTCTGSMGVRMHLLLLPGCGRTRTPRGTPMGASRVSEWFGYSSPQEFIACWGCRKSQSAWKFRAGDKGVGGEVRILQLVVRMESWWVGLGLGLVLGLACPASGYRDFGQCRNACPEYLALNPTSGVSAQEETPHASHSQLESSVCHPLTEV